MATWWGNAGFVLVLGLKCLMANEIPIQLSDVAVPSASDECTEDICVACGDPHIHTFDCVEYEYHGECDYTLVKDCGGDLSFEIIGEFERLAITDRSVSVIKSLSITCSNQVIYLNDKFAVSIDGTLFVGETEGLECGSITRYNNGVVLILDNGVTVYWSSPYKVTIVLDPAHTDLVGNLCGLCGNDNAIKYDDFTKRGGAIVPEVIEFGDSWRTDLGCEQCIDCTDSICKINNHNKQDAMALCNKFIDAALPGGGSQAKHDECMKICCATLPEVTRFCKLVDEYNIYLTTQLGSAAQVDAAATCTGGATSTPAPTTQAPTTQAPTTQAPTTQAPTTQAPTTQAPTTQAPTTTSICADKCQNDGRCVIRENADGFVCRCKDGSSGKYCENSNMVCEASGDPHYHTFAGKQYNFQGVCTYILSMRKATNTDIPEFKITVDNRPVPDRPVSVSEAVHIFIDNMEIYIGRQEDVITVKVDDENQDLPVDDVLFSINMVGENIVFTSDILDVIYNLRSTFKMRLPKSYAGKVEGLCGDGLENSDFMMPGGIQAPDVNTFGDSWAVEGCGPCEHCQSGHPCDSAAPETVDAASKCELIISDGWNPAKRGMMESDSIGAYRMKRQTTDHPFANCPISTAEYINNCKYDWCAEQDEAQLCEDISNYAKHCQNNGYIVGEWRTFAGCELACPENSTYQFTAPTCQPSCAQLSQTCDNDFDQEGCICDEGYVREGGKCVTSDTCGCVTDNGRYVRRGRAIVNKDCTKRCVCKPEGVADLDDNDFECDTSYACEAPAVCSRVDGKRDCHLEGCKWSVLYNDPQNLAAIMPFGAVLFRDDTCTVGKKCMSNGELNTNDPPPCDANARCIETAKFPGFYRCKCKQGYTGNGITCEVA